MPASALDCSDAQCEARPSGCERRSVNVTVKPKLQKVIGVVLDPVFDVEPDGVVRFE